MQGDFNYILEKYIFLCRL